MAKKLNIAVINQKGGTGKTTTSVNLAVALAQKGLRVLLIDFDPSMNATESVGLAAVAAKPGTWGSAEFTLGEGEFTPIVDQLVPGLDVVPATPVMMQLERRLRERPYGMGKRLAAAVEKVDAAYDYVIVDCAPTGEVLAGAAIAACPNVIIPIELAPLATAGAVKQRDLVEEVRTDLQPKARILGVLGTFWDKRQKTPAEMLEIVRGIFGPLVFETLIPDSTAIRDASKDGKPVVLTKPKSDGAIQYLQFCEEVVSRG